MTQRIKITADSTCDLSPALLRQWDIAVQPMHILVDGKTYLDGVSITPEILFSLNGKEHTSAAANVSDYRNFWASLSAQYDAVVHISVGSGFSSCCQNARLAAEELDNVFVVDSQNICTGQGYLVLRAAQMVTAGRTAQEICRALETLVPRVELSFVLDRLDCMARSGRCTGVMAFGANLLKIKPCLEVKGGQLKVTQKYRGTLQRCVSDYVTRRLAGREDIDRSMVLISSCMPQPQTLETVRQAVQEQGFSTCYETDIGTAIGGHSGPGTIGMVFVRKG